MTTRAETQHELFKKYQKLDDCKIFAIKRALRKFYSVPLELCDFEFVAWQAFLETEEKFAKSDHNKSYKNFYRDCLYWRAKDYCTRYVTNKHRTVNTAESMDWSTDYRSYIADTNERNVLDKIALRAYIKLNSYNEKGQIAQMLFLEHTKEHICEIRHMSKNKLNDIIGFIKEDLNLIFEMYSSD